MAHVEKALAAWTALPRPYDAALAPERLGRVLIELDTERGVAQLRAALAQLEGLGAVRDVARSGRCSAGTGWSRRGGEGDASFGDALSPREEEVLKLAQSGHTYREIGERLHLSPRTVQSHLARARRKQR